jgi:long-chain acyl-CoA synthetase
VLLRTCAPKLLTKLRGMDAFTTALQPGGSIRDLFKAARSEFADREAVVCGGLRLTYEQLGYRVDRLAGGLAELGVGSGTRVAVLAKSCHRYLEVYLATANLGAVLVPLNYRFSVVELQQIISDSGAQTILLGPAFLATWRRIRPEVHDVVNVVLLAEDGQDGVVGYEQLLRKSAGHAPSVEKTTDDLMYLFYTSGTTGRPKGVMLSERNALCLASFSRWLMQLTSEDRLLRSPTPFHVGALATWAAVSAGACQVYLPDFEPRAYLRAMHDERVTAISTVPTILNAMVHVPDVLSYDLRSLRLAMYGGSPMPEAVLRKTADTFGCPLVQVYGMTEVGFATALLREDHILAPEPPTRRIRSAGRALAGVELRIVDDQDVDLSVGEIGELLVRGPNVMLGYWNQPEATAQALTGGWMHTGDLASLDEDGYVYIVDRKKDMIITGGENVYSTEVESVLCQHPAVLEAAVIGAQDPFWGETVNALVVLNPGHFVSAEGLQAFCRERIAGYKVPRTVQFVQTLPKTATGKISKKELRTPNWSSQTQQVSQ